MKLLFALQFFLILLDCDAAKVYQCASDYEEQTSPLPISPDNNILRICIEGSNNASKCKKIVDASITQTNNSIKDTLIAAGKISPMDMTVGTTVSEQKCMITVTIPGKYFVKSASTISLEIVVMGSASMDFTSLAGRSLRSELNHSADVPEPFELSVRCVDENEAIFLQKHEAIFPRQDEAIFPRQGAASITDNLRAYQCTSDYEEVSQPAAISAESGFIRVCIGYDNSAVECEKVFEATITQADNNVQDMMVAAGQVKPKFQEQIEAKAQGSTCTLAALLDEKYFKKSAPNSSLAVNISGTISAKFVPDFGATPQSTEQFELPFWIEVTLTYGDDSDDVLEMDGHSSASTFTTTNAKVQSIAVIMGVIMSIFM